jgi:hypothetical protein
MTHESGVKRLKFVLALFIVSSMFYGILLLLTPGILVAMSGSPGPIDLSWIRWSGGALIALGIGSIQAYRKPAGQDVFLNVVTLSLLLIGLGILYSMIFDNSTSDLWFLLTPCLINLGLFVLLVWARQGAKDVLVAR